MFSMSGFWAKLC